MGPSVPQLHISLKDGFLQSSVRATWGQEGDPTASWAGFSLGQKLAGNTKMSPPAHWTLRHTHGPPNTHGPGQALLSLCKPRFPTIDVLYGDNRINNSI